MPGKASARKAALTEIIKQDVYDACVRVLLRDGLAGMTMEAVAHEAEVAKGTLYNYFRSKRDLLEYVHHSLFETIRPKLDEIAASDLPGREKLTRVIEHIVREFDNNRELLQLTTAEFGVHPMSPEVADDPLHQYFLDLHERLSKEAFAELAIRSIPPRMLARLVSCSMMGLLAHRAQGVPRRAPEEDVRDFLTFLFRDDA